MTTPPLVNVDEVSARIGDPLESLDHARLGACVADASALVRNVAGLDWLNDAGTAVEDVPDAIVTVVANVARRAYENPRGIVHETEGPFSARYGESAGQALYLTETEWAIVETYRTSSGVWTLRTSREAIDTTTDGVAWWETEGADAPVPTEGLVPREPS